MMKKLEEKKNDRSSFEIEVEFKFDDADGNDVVKNDDIEVPTEIYIKAIKEYCDSKLVKVDGSDTDIFNLFSYYLKSKDTLEDDKDFEAICRELYLKSNYYEEDLEKVAEDYGYNFEESLNEDKESMLDKIADDISNILMAKEIDAWIEITNNESVDVGTNNKETFYLIVKELKSNGYNFMRDISGTGYYGVRITENKESGLDEPLEDISDGPFVDHDSAAITEASSAQKKSFKQGGEATKDLIFGKSVARVKNPRARQAAINARKAGREDIADMFIGDRKKSQADAANVKKSTQMAKAGLSEGLGQDFYGTKEGTEEADDLLFGLQVEFGQPKYNYDDFRTIEVDEHTLELAKKHASELDKFNYFNSIKPKKSFLDPEEGLDESSTDEIAKRSGGILLPKDERKLTYKFEVLWYEGADEYEAGQSDPKTKTFDYKLDAFRFYNKHKEDTDKFDFWFTKRDAETWEVVEVIRG